MKPKKCKVCPEKFTPTKPLQMVCSPKCAYEYAVKLKEKKDKAQTKILKESLLTHKDYLKMAQQVFNTYIRKRDEKLPCISCGRIIKGQAHASHLFSVGHYPNLRFNEFNVNNSCIECNVHKHGNTAEYAIRLPKRIGEDNYNQLLEQRNNVYKPTIEELKELINHYKLKIKEL